MFHELKWLSRTVSLVLYIMLLCYWLNYLNVLFITKHVEAATTTTDAALHIGGEWRCWRNIFLTLLRTRKGPGPRVLGACPLDINYTISHKSHVIMSIFFFNEYICETPAFLFISVCIYYYIHFIKIHILNRYIRIFLHKIENISKLRKGFRSSPIFFGFRCPIQ